MKSVIVGLVLLALGAGGGYIAGRAGARLDATVDATSPVVATYLGKPVKAAHVLARLDSLGPSGRAVALQTDQLKQAAVREEARFLAMADLAVEEGLHEDAATNRRLLAVLVDAYQARHLGAKEAEPTDAEVEAFFEANKTRWEKPRRFRIAELLIRAEGQDARARAEKLLADALTRNRTDSYAFEAMARTHSEDPQGKLRSGDLGYLTVADLKSQRGDALADAVTGLEPGQLHPKVLEDAAGFRLVRLAAREEPLSPKLEVVRDSLRQRLAAERRETAVAAFLEELDRRARIELVEPAISQLR